ncbi:MAG: hypothetical protein RLN86_11665 [Cyclobacteriaceae bacterium]
MTSYDVSSFLFRFITCPHCHHDYHYTLGGNGTIPGMQEEDCIVWSSSVPSPPNPLEHLKYVPVSNVYRCTSCEHIIWIEEGVNTYCKRMENSEAAWAAMNSTSRPRGLERDELLELAEDDSLSELQQQKAWRRFLGAYIYAYEVHYDSKQKQLSWPPTPAFSKLEEHILPHLPSTDAIDKLDKAELLRYFGRFREAIDLLKQVERGDYKRIANHMIRICRKGIMHPVLIPPRFRLMYQFKIWVNRKRPGTFRYLKPLTIEDYY